MFDIPQRMRECFMYVMSCMWSVMNNTAQICIYGHPDLALYRLTCMMLWMICPAVAMKSHGFHLWWGQTNVLRARASIYPYCKSPSGSTTTLVLTPDPRKSQLGVRNTEGCIPQVCSLSPQPGETPGTAAVSRSTCPWEGATDHMNTSGRRPQTSCTEKSTTPINHPSTKCFPEKSALGFSWPFIFQWCKIFKIIL